MLREADANCRAHGIDNARLLPSDDDLSQIEGEQFDLVFSSLVLPGGRLANWTAPVQSLMPVHWAFELLDGARHGESAWTAAPRVLILLGMIAIGYVGAVLALARVRA